MSPQQPKEKREIPNCRKAKVGGSHSGVREQLQRGIMYGSSAKNTAQSNQDAAVRTARLCS